MDMIGRYEVLSKIGTGAMGEVYKVRDPTLDRIAAVKLIRSVVTSQSAVKRFEREAQAAARLSHPNIVTVYELGEHEGAPYIAMEYLDGKDLEEMLEDPAPIPIERQIEIMIQAAEGLHFAHAKGVIHRDVKPANIAVLADGTAKIMDFGIAKLGDAKVTQTGLVMGTVRYMPPEQVQGKPLDGRADLFSLGVTFYEMLTRQKAFGGDSVTSIIYNVMNVEPEPIRDLDGTPHAWLQDVVMKCIEKERENRWPDCKTFAEVLRRAGQARAEGTSSGATRTLGGSGGVRRDVAQTVAVSRPGRSPERRGGRSKILLAAAAAVLVVAAALIAFQLGGSSPRAKLLDEGAKAVAASRFTDAQSLLAQALDAEGSEEELKDARARYAALVDPVADAGDPVVAKAILDKVVTWTGPTPESKAAYRKLARSLGVAGLPEGRPPFVAALEQASEAYPLGFAGQYDSGADYEYVSQGFELARSVLARAEEPALAPRVRESLYDVARKLFLVVDEREPGFNAFELANTARSQRAKIATVARELDEFKAEVDRLVAEAETLEKDPATQVQAVANYRAVLARVTESQELATHVDLRSYRDMADASIARLEESLKEARQRLGQQKQAALLADEATGLAERGDLAGAVARYDELLKVEPANAEAQARRAELKDSLARLESRKSALEAALAKKDLSTAQALLAEAKGIAPADPALGALGARVQRLDESSRSASEGAALLAEAAALKDAGKADEAERKYREISAATKDDATRRTAEQAARAIRIERQTAEIQPLEAEARRLERAGDVEGALKAWRQVARVNAAWPGVDANVQRLASLSQASKAQAAAPAPLAAAPPPVAPPRDEAREAPVEAPLPKVDPPKAEPPPPPPVPAPDPRQQVEAVLASYAKAIENEDVDALKRAWPSLSGKQLKSVVDSFGFARAHQVRLDVTSVKATGDRAVATCNRHDRLETNEGKVIQNDSVATFDLRSTPQGWVIENLR